MTLYQDSITFGKYKGYTLSNVLRDRNYCKWLSEQDWFQNNYEYLYNRIKEYNPKKYFIKENNNENEDFLTNYTYFNLTPIENIEIELSNTDKICYEFYLEMINKIRNDIYNRLENEEKNPYNIKAPSGWLKYFEKNYGIPRTDFKEFIDAYELPNIPYVIERIKKQGGLSYKGAESFNIAKSLSQKQEQWWEKVLKEKYGEDIGTQFKYKNCIFDFINIATQTIYECKLGLKDFDEKQHTKYNIALTEYHIIYLIGYDCIVDIENENIYTTNVKKYTLYILRIPELKSPTYLDLIIKDFNIIEKEDITL